MKNTDFHESKTALIAAALAILSVNNAEGADRRNVTEPRMPVKVCAVLSPNGQDNQKQIQAAIDQCPSGQAVHLRALGQKTVFMSTPLNLRSGVWLWIDKNVTLMASDDPAAYDKGTGTCGTIDNKGAGCRPFILFSHVTGGGIVGDGEIDGQGGNVMHNSRQSWWQLARHAQQVDGKQNAPRLIEVDNAQDITFYRIRLKNSPNFHLAMNQVSGVTVWGVIIDTPATARNTDGIDPGAATDVTIAHSYIRTGDDNVAIKAGRSGPTQHISVIDNHFYQGHGMSIGSETQSGVNDILVKGLTLDGTTSGLRIKSDPSRGGVVSDITYEDVCMRNNRWPVDFDTHYDPHQHGDFIPWYKNITLKKVYGSGGMAVIKGFDNAHPAGVTLNGVTFSALQGWQTEFAQLSVGKLGASPTPPGVADSRSAISDQFCQGKFLPFPEDVR